MDWAPVIAGIGAGVLASVVGPWVTFGLDEAKERRQRRRELLDGWRAMLSEHAGEIQQGSTGAAVRADFLDDPRYLGLRRHLSREVVDRLETSTTVYVVPDATGIRNDVFSLAVLGEIDRIEDEWKLS